MHESSVSFDIHASIWLPPIALWIRPIGTAFNPCASLRQNGLFLEFSLCLSRACLGQMFVYIYKWLKIAVFSYLALMSSAPKYMQVAENCAQAECWLVAVLSEGSAALAVTLCHLYSGPALSEF